MSLEFLDTVFQAISTLGGTMAGALLDEGWSLLYACLGIMIVYHLCMLMFGGTMVDFFGDMFPLFVKFAVVTVLLLSWLDGPFGFSVKGFFVADMNVIARKINAIGTDPTSIVNTMFQMLVDLNSNNRPGEVCTSDACRSSGGWFGGSIAAVAEAVLSIGAKIFIYLLQFLASLLVIGLVAAYVFVICIGQIMVYIGLAIGGATVAFLVFPPLSFLFDGWLKFMIIASLMKVVGACVAAFVAAVITGAKASAALVTVSSGHWAGADQMALITVCIAAAIRILIMWQVPSIASAIVSGGAGVSGRAPRIPSMPNPSLSGGKSSPASAPAPAPAAAPAAR